MDKLLCSCIILCLVPTIQTYKLVDLSHPQNNATLYWPTVPKFTRETVAAAFNEENVWIESGAYTTGDHGGTHVDVPRHFLPDGIDLNDFPLDRTIAEGVVIDCRAEAKADRNYALTVEKLQQWETEHGRIPDGPGVLVYFGWAQKFPSPEDYFGTSDYSDAGHFHFPYIGEEAMQWLVDNRNLKIIGMDVASPDGPQDPVKKFPIHVTAAKKTIMILENVNIPEALPSRDFRLHASPIRIEDGTGTPTRIYAMLYDKIDNGSSALGSLRIWILALTACFVTVVIQKII